MELMLRSGGDHKPYTAPVYEGYKATVKGLLSQGYNAFFKGLFFRLVHQLAHFYAYTEISLMSGNETGLKETAKFSGQLIKLYLLQCLADVAFNAFHIMENRYILQNIIPEFKGK